jgi:competence protein ComFC
MNISVIHFYISTVKKYASLAYRALIHAIAPAYCAQCTVFLSEQTDILCQKCLDSMQPIISTTVHITNTQSIKVFAIAAYKEPLKKLILAKSYSNIAASNQLGHLIWQLTHIPHASFDIIVPIPLHWTRLASRGYNQADEIAQILSKKSGKPVKHLLKRVKRTRYQAELESALRQENVKNALVLTTQNHSLFEGKHILLVDDLMTTGATLRVAARELFKLKPASVSAVVACRVI